MAFGQGGVTIAPTHAPAPGIPAVSTCVLAYSDSYHGGPLATAFSPVEDTLAVGKDDGGVNIFDVSHYPDCRRLQNIGSPDGNAARIGHLQFSPDGSVLAISVETAEPQITTAIMRGVLRLLDVKTGVTQRELPIYQWEMNVVEPVPARGPMPNITDLQWSEAGDRISVSTSDGPVQHWNVITGTLLWSARL
jgi:WD40 repeat protein